MTKDVPRPGRPVRGSTSGRPIMAALDLLGRRGALSVLVALQPGPSTFRALQTTAGELSASTLNTRLRELRAVGLVDRGSDGYELSVDGAALIDAGQPLLSWAERWARQLPETLDTQSQDT
ncbi:winged helix-turn-helix transcriptional regulator [Rhodococcus sp. 06-1460-1B]|uniref:winged helix-turn-helix transcriptional regulator n=1 Tax=Rhodococcus sp. 06-1460-1B TaxID=2022501 RepID=UPI000B9AE21D|nr:helix-turn-helix domain-containing protein [Rhodococcus sp. 06-1460-1B]MBY4226740.1 helix-turn-helix transcriptional regulator [Rhodococcus fascians]OZD61919.1 hypothetical protein CH268_11165 [Rhodococcus sp. 06-1460-1B]